MTAALVVIAVVALLAIVALVLMARRDAAKLDVERARADRFEAQVRALEEAASVSDAGPAEAEPVLFAAGAEPTPSSPEPAAASPEPAAASAQPTAASPEPTAATAEPAAASPEPPPAPAEPTAGPAPHVPEPVPADLPTPASPEPTAAASAPTAAASAEPTAAASAEPTAAAGAEPTPAAGTESSGVEPALAGRPTAARAEPEPPIPVPITGDSVGSNSHSGVAAEPLLELERLRLEREWADIVGASTPLPVPWDGSVRGVVAVELDIIREVIGTPSRIEPDTTSPAAEPAIAVAAARLATEILRRLAKAGEEILVRFSADTDVTMAIATMGDEVKPDLSDLATTAAELGGDLAFLDTDEGFEARLRVSPAPIEPVSADHQPDSRPS